MSERNPILLLHGIDDTAEKMARLGAHLSSKGWICGAMTMTPSDGSRPLDVLAQQVAKGIEKQFGAQTIDLVAFSMGGMIARYYLQRLGGLERVKRFVTICTPHHGTLTARLSSNPVAKQLRPGSDFLADLDRDVQSLSKLIVTSIYTPFDLMIVPSTSTFLSFAYNVPVRSLLHPWMMSDQRVFAEVERALEK